MSLDPQVAAHYAGRKPASAENLSPTALRSAMDAIYNDNMPHPEVYAVSDLTVPCRWGGLPLRMYVPDEKDIHPIVLYFHGGGFVLHNIASHDSLCRALTNACKCKVISVGYRLAPEHPWPACMEDAWDALNWIYENSSALGIDPERIALAGDSAGANISSVLSLMSRDKKGPKIALQVLCYGPAGSMADCQPDDISGIVLSRPLLEFFNSQYIPEGTDESDPSLNPARAKDLSRLPKTYSITAEHDPLRDDGEAFAKALSDAGNDVTLWRVPGVLHGFLLLWEKFDISKKVIDSIGQMVRETFGI